MKKVAVIIKHPFRDADWRVDIYEVPESMTDAEIYNYVMSKMLGPFEVMGMTEKIAFDRKIKD